MDESKHGPLTEKEAVIAYATMINTSNTDVIAPLLAQDFVYESQNVFNDLVGKDAFLAYFAEKIKAMKTANRPVFADLACLHGWGHYLCAVLWQGDPLKPQVVAYADVSAGRIRRISLCVAPLPEKASRSGLWPGVSAEIRESLPPATEDGVALRAFDASADGAAETSRTDKSSRSTYEPDPSLQTLDEKQDRPEVVEPRYVTLIRERAIPEPPTRGRVLELDVGSDRPFSLPLRNAEAGLWGLIVGDAVGLPYRKHPFKATELPALDEIDMPAPEGYTRGLQAKPPGTWSEDCGQVLALLDTLSKRGTVDLKHFGKNLLMWSNFSYFTPRAGKANATCQQIVRALNWFSGGAPPEYSGTLGGMGDDANALLRAFPILMHPWESRSDLIFAAIHQARITHGHPRVHIAAAMFCLWVEAIEREGSAGSWLNAEATLRDRRILQAFHFGEGDVDFVLNAAERGNVGNSGSAAHALWNARIAFEESESFADCIKRAVLLDHEDNYLGAISGSVYGAIHGSAAVPARWLDLLTAKNLITSLLESKMRRAQAERGKSASN